MTNLKLMEIKSKHDAVKKRLLRGQSITGLEAIRCYNLYRLSSVIHRLRKEGLNIQKNMSGNYATYYIPQ